MSLIQITTTSDDRNELEEIAKRLIDQQLAACCQIVGPITSIYRWKETIEESSEWMCLIKTKESLYAAVEIAIRQIHHYDEPEIIATTITHGSAGYLDWVSKVILPNDGKA
jgi:periplasmic divalent cation tolerance protein